jgi:hypothetical protein
LVRVPNSIVLAPRRCAAQAKEKIPCPCGRCPSRRRT